MVSFGSAVRRFCLRFRCRVRCDETPAGRKAEDAACEQCQRLHGFAHTSLRLGSLIERQSEFAPFFTEKSHCRPPRLTVRSNGPSDSTAIRHVPEGSAGGFRRQRGRVAVETKPLAAAAFRGFERPGEAVVRRIGLQADAVFEADRESGRCRSSRRNRAIAGWPGSSLSGA